MHILWVRMHTLSRMQYVADFHDVGHVPIDHPVQIVPRDVHPQGCPLDPSPHRWKVADQATGAVDLGQHAVGSGGVQRAKPVVLRGDAGKGAQGIADLRHAALTAPQRLLDRQG